MPCSELLEKGYPGVIINKKGNWSLVWTVGTKLYPEIVVHTVRTLKDAAFLAQGHYLQVSESCRSL